MVLFYEHTILTEVYDDVIVRKEMNILSFTFQLTDYAVKDYNRARTYLGDLANRDGIPVFNDINEAVDCVIDRLKEGSAPL